MFLAVSAGLLVSVAQGAASLEATYPTGANVELITAATFSPSLPASDTDSSGQADVSVVVTSITTASATYSSLLGPVSAVASGERYWPRAESDPGSDAATLLGLVVNDGVLNPGNNAVTVQFGRTIGLNDPLFFFELASGTNDEAIRFAPVDSSGTLIAGWELAIDFTGVASLLPYEINREPGTTLTGANLDGFTFFLRDFAAPTGFAGTQGNLSLAEGLKVVSNNSSDPAVIGMVVPEPTTWVLLAGLLPLALWGWRRRRK